jgi:hypothetical protein
VSEEECPKLILAVKIFAQIHKVTGDSLLVIGWSQFRR